MSPVSFFDRNFGRTKLFLAMCCIALLWLLVLSAQMITDVWDETTARVFFTSEPTASLSTLELVRLVWLHELGLNVYRPLSSSLFIVFNRLADGNLLVLRYINALFVLASVSVLSFVLLSKVKISEVRILVFFALMLFSSTSLMTSGWVANIYDASCLFFISVAVLLYYQRAFFLSAVSLSLAVFCKESYVLAFPFLLFLFYEDDRKRLSAFVLIVTIVLIVSLYYWINRHLVVPVGSPADLHGFDLSLFPLSTLSFVAGIVFQHSKFEPYDTLLWIGLLMTIVCVLSVKTISSKLTVFAIILLSSLVYWGMFSFQGEAILTAHNFVARLYLIPLVMIVFILIKEAHPVVIIVFAVLSSYGAVDTFRDHIIFQETYQQIYELAQQSDEQLVIHFPERLENDSQRNILIGNYPEADWEISTNSGGIRQRIH